MNPFRWLHLRLRAIAALVHEAYLKLADDSDVGRRGRPYFFAAASRAMRQVLVDHARRRRADKRGGGVDVVTLDDEVGEAAAFTSELLDLDEALRALAEANPRHARVVECRFFGGMSVEDRIAASRWLVARGDSAAAARLSRWHEAVLPGQLYPVNEVNRLLADAALR